MFFKLSVFVAIAALNVTAANAQSISLQAPQGDDLLPDIGQGVNCGGYTNVHAASGLRMWRISAARFDDNGKIVDAITTSCANNPQRQTLSIPLQAIPGYKITRITGRIQTGIPFPYDPFVINGRTQNPGDSGPPDPDNYSPSDQQIIRDFSDWRANNTTEAKSVQIDNTQIEFSVDFSDIPEGVVLVEIDNVAFIQPGFESITVQIAPDVPERTIVIRMLTPRFPQKSDSDRYKDELNRVVSQEIAALVGDDPFFQDVTFEKKSNSNYYPILEPLRAFIDEFAFLTNNKNVRDLINPENLRAFLKNPYQALRADVANFFLTGLAAAHENYAPSEAEIMGLAKKMEEDAAAGKAVILVAYSTSTQLANKAYSRVPINLRDKIFYVYIAGTAPNIADPVGTFTTEFDDDMVRKLRGLRWNTNNNFPLGVIIERIYALDNVGHDLQTWYTRPNSNTMDDPLVGIRRNIRNAISNAEQSL